jgi:hypothetical protein
MAGFISSAGVGGTTRTGSVEFELAGAGTAVDFGAILDNGPFIAFRKLIVLLAALEVIFGGYDTQMVCSRRANSRRRKSLRKWTAAFVYRQRYQWFD